MKEYIKKYLCEKFALTDAGAEDLIKSVFWSIWQNISYMFPSMLGFYFIRELLAARANGTAVSGISFYLLLSFAVVAVMFMVAVRQYVVTYVKTYEESARMRISLAEKLRKLPLAFFGKRDIADLSATIMGDATEIEMLFSHAVPQIYASLISTAIFSAMLFFFQWQLTLAMLWVLPVAYTVFALFRNLQKKSLVGLHKDKLVIADAVQEGLDCMAELKAYHYGQEYVAAINAKLDAYEKRLIRDEFTFGSLVNFSHIILNLGLVSVVLVEVWLFSAQAVDLFTLIVFMIVAASIYNPLILTINNMAALLFLEVRIERKKEMDAMPVQEGRTEFSPQHFDIEFRDVSFSYDDKARILNGISFTAKQGEVTALVGPSGGGKSTTAKLAARFWDTSSGKVTLGDTDISKIAPETLLEHYSIVFQDVLLFNFSVMENIRLGRKGATDEEVMSAARLAQCDEFISRLPDGYNTQIGENGARLSGGERQRISIARAILKDAPIILLDEATASLDAENETKIQQALSELVKDKTVLLIAHRMRTVLGADHVVVIRDGQIVEKGTPDELLEQNGFFAAMNRQRLI